MSDSIQQLVRESATRFSLVSDSARLDAEILLAYVLVKPRSYLYSWPEKIVEPEQVERFQGLVEQRLKPTPIAYLTGEKEFYSLTFKTDASTLIPRPETEQLVERAIDLCRDNQYENVLDLGTGTGAIPIAIKHHCREVNVFALDVSSQALELAELNAKVHNADIAWIESNWFDGLDVALEFDLIISNPPYIATDDPWLKRGDLPAEPITALCPGKSGLESLEIIIPQSRHFLRQEGYLLLEHGHDQALAVKDLCQANGFTNIHCYRDDGQLPRITQAQLLKKR